jgi:hypothetical protein
MRFQQLLGHMLHQFYKGVDLLVVYQRMLPNISSLVEVEQRLKLQVLFPTSLRIENQLLLHQTSDQISIC